MRKMNKKGQPVFVGIMVAIMVFIAVTILIQPLKDQVTIARDSDHLDCDNASITVGTEATCILVDFWLFYFVGAAIGGGIWYITKKKVVAT